MVEISRGGVRRAVRRRRPATRCGSATPTCGSRSRRTCTVGGEEAVFGGGKSIRESMAQGTTTRAEGALDTVITNALVLDHWGIVRADVGIRDGRIVALGRAGNPDIADGVHPDLLIGPSTDVISGEGKILTAGAIDSHVHLLSPSQLAEALATGITTLVRRRHRPVRGLQGHHRHAGRLAPAARSTARSTPCRSTCCCWARATRSAPPAWPSRRWPAPRGYKVHEDWGSTPAAIDAALRAADEWGLQVALHSDSPQRGRLRRVDDRARSAAGRSTPSTPRAPAAGTRPTSCRSPACRT